MFRTPVTLVPYSNPIPIESKLLSIGSCFADFIGGQLVKNKFSITSNPFGVIFHPLAQFQLLQMVLKEQMPPENSYLQHQGIWYNFFFHGSISGASREELKNWIRQIFTHTRNLLAELDYLFFTFGTAIQYQHLETGLVVANCHKVPQKEFNKSLTAVETIVRSCDELFSIDNSFTPRIVLSVSPVRHLSEGIENNSLSKSVLRVACAQLSRSNPQIDYFPGFEIMLDDLRDYRFYEKDMIHPNETAREYIWNMFTANYLDEKARNFIDEWLKITRSLEHRPFHPHSTAHQEFIKKTLEKIKRLPDSIDTTEEVALLTKNLK